MYHNAQFNDSYACIWRSLHSIQIYRYTDFNLRTYFLLLMTWFLPECVYMYAKVFTQLVIPETSSLNRVYIYIGMHTCTQHTFIHACICVCIHFFYKYHRSSLVLVQISFFPVFRSLVHNTLAITSHQYQ